MIVLFSFSFLGVVTDRASLLQLFFIFAKLKVNKGNRKGIFWKNCFVKAKIFSSLKEAFPNLENLDGKYQKSKWKRLSLLNKSDNFQKIR